MRILTPVIALVAGLGAVPAASADQSPLPEAGHFELLAAGDFTMHEGLFDQAAEDVGPACLDGVRELLAGARLKFLNLETPVTARPFALAKQFLHRMPAHRLQWLLDGGFNLLSLANNHMADAGEGGIADTVESLTSVGSKRPVAFAGAGPNLHGTDVDVDGTKVRFLAVACNGGSKNVAQPGPWVLADIARAREDGKTVIVSAHCGQEFHHTPDAGTVAMYRNWIDAGADVVLGHHPHVVQGVELRGPGVIFYSLGNFVFSSLTKRHLKIGARFYGMLGLVSFVHGRVSGVRVVPLWVSGMEKLSSADGDLRPRHLRPQVLHGAFARETLERFSDFSAQIPGNSTRFEVQGDMGVAVNAH